ncbi:MAG: hypothetical protein KDA84_01920 [Planctomycetaceae bacterium]|nr:hypothetical protein [Planctomycetaceae bacterium]
MQPIENEGKCWSLYRVIQLTVFGALMMGLGAFLVFVSQLIRGDVILTSLSPNDSWRVTLHEYAHLDRNLRIVLEDLETGEVRTVFFFFYEGRPSGSEKIVWSKDGTKFLLLGRHFIVDEQAELSTGEQAYLLMDVAADEIWCNARQEDRYPRFDVSTLQTISWEEWLPSSM